MGGWASFSDFSLGRVGGRRVFVVKKTGGQGRAPGHARLCRWSCRSIPTPAELEASLRRVVETFARVEDAKTGLQLFTPKTWDAFKSTIVHIRKGCVSDHPADVNYHYQIGITTEGYPKYRCIRGTSPIEGYHHHLRMLVAQSCISPRLLISLLRCFNYRWNNDMAADNGDLPPFYRGGYCHWLVEEVQEATMNWGDEAAHPDWISTKDFAPTDEVFYLITNQSSLAQDHRQGRDAHPPIGHVSLKHAHPREKGQR